MTPTTIYDLTFNGEAWKVNAETRYEYGIFNADKDKVCAANDVNIEDPDWYFLWKEPFGYEYNEQAAQDRVDEENLRRENDGKLDVLGPVIYRRRTVNYGEWEDM